ncbi:MAG: hypothetical protein RL341_745 [Pseudomonadota bacterium]
MTTELLSWREKLAQHKAQAKVRAIPPRMQVKTGPGTIAIPDAREVDEIIAQVPRRKLVTPSEMGAYLARKHGATIGCTVSAGILTPLVARAAFEAEQLGLKPVTPYWRALKTGGELNPKFPGGIENLMLKLEAEGHVIVQRGKRFFVENYEEKLVQF